METTFTFRNMEATDSLRSYTEEKLTKLKKFIIKPGNAHIIFNVEKFNHIVEITLVANGIRYVGVHRSNDMYMSVDSAVDKVKKQLRNYKERLKGHGRGEG